MTQRRLLEAVGVAAFGGALAFGAGSIVELAVPFAVVGAANGAVSGWRRIYDWNRSGGLVAFTLDSTWGLVMTTAGLFANAVGMAMPNSGYVADLSERQNRHVYRRGFMPRAGFAITLGNVVGGAGDVERERRRRLITDHEDVHCWQARWFGPLYPVLYVGWMILGGGAGIVIWLTARRADRFAKVVESSAYFLNPFEWWAYSRDDYWPPNGKVEGMGWKRPCCRPLALVKQTR
jgi:hypothetical protein